MKVKIVAVGVLFIHLIFSVQAGIVESLDVLVKEFVAASDEEKKSVFTRMEEEVEKLKGSASRHGKIYLKVAKNYLEKKTNETYAEFLCLLQEAIADHIYQARPKPFMGLIPIEGRIDLYLQRQGKLAWRITAQHFSSGGGGFRL
ncbi:putative protein disulfide-isomerase A6 [Glycine max]|nr:putative protein disulfide-isomerase A6 [Glycine max]|eukprot:XP_014626172.1 uncharacterized protein LOC102664941 [Glycine max]